MSEAARDEAAEAQIPPQLAQSVTDAITGADDADTPADRPIGQQRDDFARLYINYRDLLQRRAFRYLSDPRDVEDVLQETFIRVFLALDELETERSAIRFAQRVLVNLCIDYYRTQQRRPRCIDLDAAGPELIDDDLGDPLVRAEDAAVVRKALALLSPQHREALVKREIEEKPLVTVAQELQVPEEQVRVLVYRARRALRRILVGSSVDPDAEFTAGELGALAGRRLVSAAGTTAGRAVTLVVVVVTGFAACVAGLQASTGQRGAVADQPPSLSRPFGVLQVPGAGTASGRQPHRSTAAERHSPRTRPSAMAATHQPAAHAVRASDGSGSAAARHRHAAAPLRTNRPRKPPAGTDSSHTFALHGLLRSRSATVAHQSHATSDGGQTLTSTADFLAQTNAGLFVMAQTLQIDVDGDGTTTAAGSAAPDIPMSGGGTSYVADAMHVTLVPDAGGYLVTMSGLATPADSAASALDLTVVAHFDSSLTAIGSEQVYLSPDASSSGGSQPSNPGTPSSAPSDPATSPPADTGGAD